MYRVRDDKRRCARCGYTFHDFSQRFVAGCWTSALQWLWFLKLFELEVDPHNMARQLRCSYATVLKAQDITRRAILTQGFDAGELYKLGIWPGPRRPKLPQAMDNSPIFGMMDINGLIVCDVLPDISPQELLHFKLNFRLKTSNVGQVVYTAPYQGYQALIGCGPDLWPARHITHDDKRIPVDSGGFWPYAKSRLKKLRGVLPAQFPLHLKEWEFRYNHQNNSLFNSLAGAVCSLVPDPDQSFRSVRGEPHGQGPDARN